MKNDVYVPSKSTVICKKIVFDGVMKINDENSRDPDPLVRGMDPRIRINTKCHGSQNCLPSMNQAVFVKVFPCHQ